MRLHSARPAVNATIAKGPTLRDEIVECANISRGGGRITFPVTYCTDYSDRRQPSLREMEQTAWILRSDPKRNQIGFVPASTLRERDRHVLYED